MVNENPAPAPTPRAALPEIDRLWDYADPAASEGRFRDQLAAFELSGDTDRLLQLLTQLARAQGLQGKFDDAHRTLDRVRDRLTADLPVARARYLLERGRVLNSAGRPADARPLFEEAVGVARAAGAVGFEIDALHMVAIVAPDPAEQLAWNERALARVADNPGQERWLVPLCNNAGEAALASGRPEAALGYFRRLADRQRALGRPVAWYVHKDVARCLRLLGRLDEAEAALRPAVEAAGGTNGYLEEEIAEQLLARGRATDARAHFARAFELLKDDPGYAAHPDALARLRALAGLP